MGSNPTYTKRIAAITFALLAVISPLYIDREHQAVEVEEAAEVDDTILPPWLLPLGLVVLVCVICFMNLLDRRYVKFDLYWIHRVGGSSCGIAGFLLMLVFVLRCKERV